MKPYLPLEIITNILLRLSFRSIAVCKCICKSWLNLIENDVFVTSYFSRFSPALAVSTTKRGSNWFHVFKLDDEFKPFSSNLLTEHGPITKFDFRRESIIQCSANGLLLLLVKNAFMDDHLCVCNPMTRDFVELHGRVVRERDRFGFGVSKISGQHKVVYLDLESGFHVYTLKAGSMWRVVEAALPLYGGYCNSSICGAFFRGNLHWLVESRTWIPYVCCFDLETERVSTFPAPLNKITFTCEGEVCGLSPGDGKLYGLGDCLCYHSNKPYINEIWLLREYEQMEKCWIKVKLFEMKPYYEEYGMHSRGYNYAYKMGCQPMKIYENGGMLMLSHDKRFFYYSKEKRTVRELVNLYGKVDDDCSYFSSIFFTPTFLSLKRNLGMENARNLGTKNEKSLKRD